MQTDDLAGRSALTWNTPPEMLYLATDEIHVWRACLNLSSASIESLARTLSLDERARAVRFRFQHDRLHFVATRGILRILIGRYTGQDPGMLRFSYGLQGKPTLVSSDRGLRICFNLSHAHGIAVFGFTRDREIGIDVERIRIGIAQEPIAERFFSLYEAATLRSLPQRDQDLAFVTCWTRKEAYIKARGGGLSLDLTAFDVTLSPGKPAMLLETRDDPDQVLRWALLPIEPGPGYVGTVAIEGSGGQLRCWHWTKEIQGEDPGRVL